MKLADRFPTPPPAPTSPVFDYYPHAEATKPTAETNLDDLLAAVRADDFAADVANVRDLLEKGGKKQADALKKKLPAVSISGRVTSGGRAKAADQGRFIHSGLIQIDLDAKDNIGWTVDEMRDALMHDPRVVAVFTSASGAGVKGIARVPANVETHRACFLAAEAHFRSMNLTIDPACKDPVRLCFISHDPRAWLRMDGSAMFEPVELELVENLDDEEEQEHRESPFKRNESGEPARSYKIGKNGGLLLRETGGPLIELTPDIVRGMLARIPPRPDYDKWLKIASAVWDALGESDGTAALCTWSPEEEPGEYASKFQKRLSDVHAASLIYIAQENGWAPPRLKSPALDKEVDPNDKNTIPLDVFPIPNGDIGNDLAARHIMAVIAPSRRMFVRGTAVHEVLIEANEPKLEPIKPTRLTSVIEEFGATVMVRERREDGTARWRKKIMGANHCEMLLNSTAARESLPTIQQLAGAPVLARTPDGPLLLGPGWHPHAGGTFVTGNYDLPDVTFDEALEILTDELLCDFNFPGIGDAARAAASFISPALKMGRWIEDDFPVDVAEADQSQAGKSYRHKLIASVYGEAPYTITNSTGGVGSFDERIGGALIAGRPIITLENIRGRIDSQTLESAIRGQARVVARSYRACVEVSTAPFIWQLSTNNAELTRDLANRSIITRIRKQPEGYTYRAWPEGQIFHHISANHRRYLAAMHAIVRRWAEMGCPKTDESRHDFRGWCQSLDWITRNLLDLGPLLDGHKEEQLRTANPKLQWLRDVVHAAVADGAGDQPVTASDLADTAEHHDIKLPGRREGAIESLECAIGKVMSRLFKECESDMITVDGFTITRRVEHEWDPINRSNRERRIYIIQRA
jgi:hypothetical protein